MTRGGARNRGPLTRSPNSEAARQRYAGALVLPHEGYRGDPPAFPLPDASERELAVWAWAWTTPQAAAWAVESWRWRTVALWTRLTVRCEAEDASAAVMAQATRLADQVGLTPAGLVDNGWRVSEPPPDQSEARRPPSLSAVPSPNGGRSLARARERAERSRSRFPVEHDPRDVLHGDDGDGAS